MVCFELLDGEKMSTNEHKATQFKYRGKHSKTLQIMWVICRHWILSWNKWAEIILASHLEAEYSGLAIKQNTTNSQYLQAELRF